MTATNWLPDIDFSRRLSMSIATRYIGRLEETVTVCEVFRWCGACARTTGSHVRWYLRDLPYWASTDRGALCRLFNALPGVLPTRSSGPGVELTARERWGSVLATNRQLARLLRVCGQHRIETLCSVFRQQ